MTTHAAQSTPADLDGTPLALAVTWTLEQAGSDVLGDAVRFRTLLAEAPVDESPERTMLVRNLDEGFLAPFAEAIAAEGQPEQESLEDAIQEARHHLVETCYIDERIAQSAATQFAQGLAAVGARKEEGPAPIAPAAEEAPAAPTAEEVPAAPTTPEPPADSVAPAADVTAPSPVPVGMKTYAPATGDHDSLSARVNTVVGKLGQRKARTLAVAACALALGAYLLFSLVSPNKAKLTFHGNGATGGVMMSITADQGSLVELPLCGFRRDGYEFVGWYNENTHELLLAQSLVTAQGRVSYMAEWAPIVQFDTGGSNPASLEPITVTRGDTIELPKATFSKPPYDFLGWSVAGNEGTWNEPGQTVTVSGPTTFVATWGYTISFKGNGATEGSVANIKALEGAKVLLPANGFTFAEHKFSGWAQDIYETKPAKPGEEVTVNRSLVFNAIWRNKVMFDGNGATSGTTKAFFARTSGRFKLPECGFEREGYQFVGWSAEKPQAEAEGTDEAQAVVDTDAAAALPEELHQPGERLLIGQPTTYYAYWEPVEEQA